VPEAIKTSFKDGVAWPIGGQEVVDWIAEGTERGRRITRAIPPLFAAYATLTDVVVEGPRDVTLERRQDLAFVDVLRRHSGHRAWWIGYLDTGRQRHRVPGRANGDDLLQQLALCVRARRPRPSGNVAPGAGR